jgi:hypothetical protein
MMYKALMRPSSTPLINSVTVSPGFAGIFTEVCHAVLELRAHVFIGMTG